MTVIGHGLVGSESARLAFASILALVGALFASFLRLVVGLNCVDDVENGVNAVVNEGSSHEGLAVVYAIDHFVSADMFYLNFARSVSK